jgi:hypothetical protein
LVIEGALIEIGLIGHTSRLEAKKEPIKSGDPQTAGSSIERVIETQVFLVDLNGLFASTTAARDFRRKWVESLLRRDIL